MSFEDREWYREEVRRKQGRKDSFSVNAHNKSTMSVNDWLASQNPNKAKKIQTNLNKAKPLKGRRVSFKKLLIFLALSISLAFTLKATVGNPDFSIQKIMEHLTS